jgi:hypothetical protein
MDDIESFLDEPVAEVKIKPWHILAILGVGGVAAYFLLRKSEPAAPALPAPKPAAKPTGTSGLGDFAALGEQTEPLYEGAALVDKAREYVGQGWTVFKLPTGQQNVMNNRERFDIQKVYAAPPGRRLPPHAERIEF